MDVLSADGTHGAKDATSSSAFRARLKDIPDVHGMATELARHVVEAFGFHRCAILVDASDSGIFTVESTHGCSEQTKVDSVRLRAADANVSSLLATGIHETAGVAPIDALGMTRMMTLPLRDAEGQLGWVLAGHGDDEPTWPPTSPAKLAELLADILTDFRYRLIKRRFMEDRAVRLSQQAEIEALLRELRKRNEEMLDDLEQAREFQSQMLTKPPQVDGLSIQIVYRPHDAVSGDLHDLYWNGTHLRVFLADTTGHGVRAGLATMLLKAEYEGVKHADGPAAVLMQLNARIAAAYRPATLTLTAVCFDFERASGKVTYATAAHPSPVVVRGGIAEELASGGTLIGVVDELAIVEGTTEIGPNDAIYVYTDGISEASDPNGELFGEERVIAGILEGHDQSDGARLLYKKAEAFARPHGFADDVAIVAMRYASKPVAGRDAAT